MLIFYFFLLYLNTFLGISFEDEFPLIFEYFSLSERLYGYFVSSKDVLSFSLLPPVINNSKDKCPNGKNQFSI